MESIYMRNLCFILLLFTLMVSCQDNDAPTSTEVQQNNVPPLVAEVKPLQDSVTIPTTTSNNYKLALASNALQLVNAVTGSTKEIAFGRSFDDLVELISLVLDSKPINIGMNSECGAGPLQMATWSNGLTIVFKEKQRGDANWLFAGWLANKPTRKRDKIQTMAGIGVGSTLEELKSAYTTTVKKTTLGQEFSVKSGFYGLLSGTGKSTTIDVMWSGVSCNFR